MGKIINFIKHPSELVTSLLAHYGTFIPDEQYLKIHYRIKIGRKLNLDNPTLFSEKLQWYKLHDRNPLYTKLVDKYEVTKYVAEKVGKQYLIPMLGVWDDFDDIDFNSLPDQFVLKCTHDSGGFRICKDKKNFDKKEARAWFKRCVGHNFYWYSREWAYKNVKPRIVAQEFVASLGKPESVEYKLTCFDGVVKLITICQGIAHSSFDVRTNDNFDRDFNPLPFYAFYKNSGKHWEKPQQMDEMIAIAEKLSQGIPQVRVDFYVIDGKVYFGEMTFYTWAGFLIFTPEEWDQKMGEWFHLPPKDRWSNVMLGKDGEKVKMDK